MNELESKIKYYAQKYYTDGSSELTDEEFDKLVDKLKFEYPDSLLLRVGWGYDVENDTTPGAKRHHLYSTIGSLDKCHNLKELGNDFINLNVDVSTKLDGLSVVLYYENSMLKYALTRGDSQVGIDITDKILKINREFLFTNLPFTGAVRGEIVMSFENFEKFKALHPKAKNPRNSTAGLVNGKDTFEDLTFLDVVLYTLVHDDKSIIDPQDTVSSTRFYLAELFDSSVLVPYVTTVIPNFIDEDQFQDIMNELKGILYQKYPADGIVISKNKIVCNNGTYVYTAKAFKFPAESKITTITDIEWNMGKTKIAVPRILLEPVELSGTTVSACSGYNAKYIEENNLGVGSVVEIWKANEIIPNIVKVHKSSYCSLPFNCPDCGTPLEWRGVNLVCPNTNCSNSIEQDTLIWLQNLVPLDNLGDTLKLKFLNELIEEGLLEDLSIESIMYSKLKFSEEFPSVQFNNFAKMWNKLHDPEVKFNLSNALIACNIPRIGDLTAIKFSNYPEKIQNWLDVDYDKFYPIPLEDIKSLGAANMESIGDNLNKMKRLNLIRDRIIWREKKSSDFKGRVAVTGKLSVKRSDFEKEIKKFGYELGDISKDTLFLITDSVNSGSSKNKKADQLGIQKITELEFRRSYMK